MHMCAASFDVDEPDISLPDSRLPLFRTVFAKVSRSIKVVKHYNAVLVAMLANKMKQTYSEQRRRGQPDGT